MLKDRLAWIALVAGLSAAIHVAVIASIPGTLMRLAINRITESAGVNVIQHAPLVDAESRVIVRPSPDLAYSVCAFDLTEGPVELSVRPVNSPYWSVSVYDSSTNAVFVRNDEDTAGEPIRIVVAQNGQVTPLGAETVRMPDEHGLALFRILLTERGEFTEIDVERRATRCEPLD
jgi:uncharacterized membrane protein